jgi:hypothetical protein
MTYPLFITSALILAPTFCQAQETGTTRVYDNRLTPIKNAAPLLADHPDYVEPIKTGPRFLFVQRTRHHRGSQSARSEKDGAHRRTSLGHR